VITAVHRNLTIKGLLIYTGVPILLKIVILLGIFVLVLVSILLTKTMEYIFVVLFIIVYFHHRTSSFLSSSSQTLLVIFQFLSSFFDLPFLCRFGWIILVL